MNAVEFGQKIADIVQHLSQVNRGIYIAPNITLNTERLALNADKKTLLFVANASAFGNGKLYTGMAASIDTFYYCNEKDRVESFQWSEVQNVTLLKKTNYVESFFKCDQIQIQLYNGKRHILEECMIGFDCNLVEKLITDAAKFTHDGVIATNPWQCITLSLDELPQEVLLAYMEILYNYAYITGEKVESVEYSALQSIGVRIGLSAEIRSKLRSYLLNIHERNKTGNLVNACKKVLSFGSYEIFRYSLMQDALYLSEVNGEDICWTQDAFLVGLQRILNIKDNQIETMLAAIHLHKNMQRHHADLSMIQRDMDKIFSHAKTVSIPQETIFCSGSVYTVDTYIGIFKYRKQKVSISKQRELMLQEIIRNSQKTVNYLLEEINDVTIQLMDAVQKGNERSILLQSLTKRMKQFMEYSNKTQNVQKELYYNGIQNVIDIEQINMLDEVQKALVLQCYEKRNSVQWKIKENLPSEMLVRIQRIEVLKNEE